MRSCRSISRKIFEGVVMIDFSQNQLLIRSVEQKDVGMPRKVFVDKPEGRMYNKAVCEKKSHKYDAWESLC